MVMKEVAGITIVAREDEDEIEDGDEERGGVEKPESDPAPP